MTHDEPDAMTKALSSDAETSEDRAQRRAELARFCDEVRSRLSAIEAAIAELARRLPE